MLQHLVEPQPCSLLENARAKGFFCRRINFLFLCDSSRGLTWSVFLSSTIKVDDFTARLFRIYVQVLEEGLAQVLWQGIPVVCAPWQCGRGAWALAASFGTVDSELCRLLTPYPAMSCPVEQLSSLVGAAGNSLAWRGRISCGLSLSSGSLRVCRDMCPVGTCTGQAIPAEAPLLSGVLGAPLEL